MIGRGAFAMMLVGLAACSSGGSSGASTDGGAGSSGSAGTGGAAGSAGTAGSGGSAGIAGSGGVSGSAGVPGSAGAAGAAGSGPPTAAALLAKLGACNELTNGRYKTDADPGVSADVPVCGLNGAVYWQADMDVDCDGITTQQCNSTTDPWYQAQTAATDSSGGYLDAASLPYVVVPSASSRFNFKNAGLSLGSVVAVIYQGKVAYGVIGDTGPVAIIGEASYAMAAALGIDPDPATGGADSGVTYIAFTGTDAVPSKLEDHAEAQSVGEARAAQLLSQN